MTNNKHFMKSLTRAALALLISFAASSCSTSSNVIAYRVADHYFLNNDVKEMPAPKVDTERTFHRLFGEDAVMGQNGIPTTIDFSKEYLIAVCKPETHISTELTPVSLTKDAGGNI